MPQFYNSPEWADARLQALERDQHRCTVGALFGGGCSGCLHVHHVLCRADHPDLELDLGNLMTVCASHHPVLESARRFLEGRRLRRCRHRHVSAEARRLCEARLNREMVA